jgi:TRAP-type C4-dicarboxylate transport system substrate-binding protein
VDLALVAVALVGAATACGGSGGDKAGGQAEGKPVVLTLAKHDTAYAFAEFVDSVEELSGGSIRIEVLPDWRGGETDYERGIVEDVRDGVAQLGVVGVRVWDTMGVTGFRALLAPLLVDSMKLQRRVLASPVPGRILESVAEAGVVGLAVLPGALRRPVGFSRPLVGPEDYVGATVGIRPGGVAEATFRTLKASADAYVPSEVSALDGAELDLATIAQNGYDELARSLPTNVVLWPRAETIVINREAFEALSSGQQEILRRAGREALAPELDRVERDEEAALAAVCERDSRSFVIASATDLASLREAVQPVYDDLERDPQTKEWLAEIVDMRADEPAAPGTLSCPEAGASATVDPSRIEGRWRVSWTREELIAAGLAPKDADALRGTWVVEFANGRFGPADEPPVGTYAFDGDVISLVFESRLGGVTPGKAYELRWSVYRDSLAFSAVPGREPLLANLIKPFTRVR